MFIANTTSGNYNVSQSQTMSISDFIMMVEHLKYEAKFYCAIYLILFYVSKLLAHPYLRHDASPREPVENIYY